MDLCKKQNESRLQMVARPTHSKGTCPVPLHSWKWGSGTAHRPGNFQVNTSCPPSGVHVVPWNKKMWPRTAHLCPHLKNKSSFLLQPQQRNPSGQVTAASLLKKSSHALLHTVQQWWHFIHMTSGLFTKICLPVYSSLKCQQHCGFLYSCRHRKLILRHMFL